MAAVYNNITLLNEADPRFSVTCLVAAGAVATIQAGTPTKSADATTAATGAIVPMVDGDGTTSQNFTGIAKGNSTETASVAGTAAVWLPLPGYVYAAKAKTAATADTAAEVLALFRKRVVFDLTSSFWSVDAAAADAAVNMVTIIGGDYQTKTLYFVYKTTGTCIAAID